MIDGIPVMTAPPEIDITTADQLRTVLLDMATWGHATVVVDLTLTRFCDSYRLHALLRAHKLAHADGGELRLVTPLTARSSYFCPDLPGLEEGPSPGTRCREPASRCSRARLRPASNHDHNSPTSFRRLDGCVNKQLKSLNGCRASRSGVSGRPARMSAWPT
jgi:anti-anti-sigma factor